MNAPYLLTTVIPELLAWTRPVRLLAPATLAIRAAELRAPMSPNAAWIPTIATSMQPVLTVTGRSSAHATSGGQARVWHV